VKKPSQSNFDYCLISCLAHKLLEWLSESLTHSYQAGRKYSEKELQEGASKEVNQNLGLAIHSLLHKYYQKFQDNNDEDVSNKQIVEFLGRMRIFHHDAINNETYLGRTVMTISTF
jgi:hypothetical protein